MIRPFDWRDLALLHRVRDRGLCLDSQLAYTRGSQALGHALLELFNPNTATTTLVLRPDRGGQAEAVGQFMHRNGRPHARLAFVGPTEAMEGESGLALLEALARSAGERGAHNLIAEVDEQNPTFETLRRAGFAIYARQRIWHLGGASVGETQPGEVAVGQDRSRSVEGPLTESDDGRMWRHESGEHSFATQSLYANLVPAMVQQVEPPPFQNGRNLVYWHGGELLGYLDIERGSLGTWVQAYFHPAAERLDQLLFGFIHQSVSPIRWPLYFCVRSYQSWMGGPLDRLGFAPCSDQAVMVKRLAARVRRVVTEPLTVLEGTYPETSAPFVPALENSTNSQARGNP